MKLRKCISRAKIHREKIVQVMSTKAKTKHILTMAAIVILLSACSPLNTDPESTSISKVTKLAGGPVSMRRITSGQYERIIGHVFGSTIELGGRFEPDVRSSGLLEVGASRVSVTPSGFEQYDLMGRNIAAQILSEKNRPILMPCLPAAVDAPDNTCAAQFLGRVGRLLYRRPLTDGELSVQVDKAAEATEVLSDFYAGLELSLASMLVSPPFLFRQEVAEPDPDYPGSMRLDGYSKAGRLSFFLWDAAPDPDLLQAAESGELHTREGLESQVERMLESPRLKDGVRAFFSDMLEFDSFKTLSKDTALYPKFTFRVVEEAAEQTLRTITHHLLFKNKDYRDLFTTPYTFLTPLLGSLYRVPVSSPDGWATHKYGSNDAQAGILTHLSFVALHSHPGRTSPTLRGKALREVLLCQKVPDPPGNVDFNIVQDTANPNFKTVRQRLDAHASEPMCVGCHKITDPLGLALENFNTIGGYRTTENGAVINTGGELDGVMFSNASGLGRAVRDNPATASCLVNRIYSYGVGRMATQSESAWLSDYIEKHFHESGYKLPQLLRIIATSDAFYRVLLSDPGAQIARARSNAQLQTVEK
ncbi:MAG TPA: hypothetical protein DGZ24_06585 [Rhodospirillaceae bacterium]|nr:hypothetical protein [Rhodospirillaceae bacterium]